MAKRTAEENVADHGNHTAPVSATRRTTPDHQTDGYSLTKKPFLSLEEPRFEHKKRLSLRQPLHVHGTLNLDERPKESKRHSDETGPTSEGFLNLSNKTSDPKSSGDRTSQACAPKQAGSNDTRPIGGRLQSSAETSKHLVKSLSDMPTFVTIEGFRVASYTVDGEPYLSLPNLLHFIQQKYPIEKAVDIFEETVTNFVSATPKQIEGFIKAIVLPPDAKSCPLIRRSDADRICLALFDQCSPANISKTIIRLPDQGQETVEPAEEVCDGEDARREKSIVDQSSDEIASSIDKSVNRVDSVDHERSSPANLSGRKLQFISNRSGSEEVTSADDDKLSDKCIQELSSDSDLPNKLTHIRRNLQVKSFFENNWATQRLSPGPSKHLNEKSLSLDSDDLTSTQEETSSDTCDRQGDTPSREKLFEMEAQPTILNLARAATSTLIIHVYHRCFGKCNGYYYPSMFKNNESESIECATCHRMLSPRRFIGHTHGTKETNVCHWGFNSYNWRKYIHLSRKQTLNKLDDDELIVQIQTLKSVIDSDDQGQQDEDDLNGKDDERRSQAAYGIQVPANRGSVGQSNDEFVTGHDDVTPEISQATDNSPRFPTCGTLVGNDYTQRSSTSKSHSEGEVQPWLDRESDLCSQSHARHWPSVDQILGGSYSPVTAANLIPRNNDSIKSLISNGGLSTALYPTYHNHSLAAAHCGALTAITQPRPIPSTSHANLSEFRFAQSNIQKPVPPTTEIPYTQSLGSSSLSSSSDQSLSLETKRLIKQDIFVSSGLVSYLSSRGLSSELARSIVDSTLDLIHKSRILF